MDPTASTVARMQAGAFSQQIGTAVARQQATQQRAVADLVAGTAATASSATPPAGQGRIVDLKV